MTAQTSFFTAVSCAHPACPSRREYAYGTDMSVMNGNLLQHGMTDQCISATKFRWPWRIDPVEIEDAVVH